MRSLSLSLTLSLSLSLSLSRLDEDMLLRGWNQVDGSEDKHDKESTHSTRKLAINWRNCQGEDDVDGSCIEVRSSVAFASLG